MLPLSDDTDSFTDTDHQFGLVRMLLQVWLIDCTLEDNLIKRSQEKTLLGMFERFSDEEDASPTLAV